MGKMASQRSHTSQNESDYGDALELSDQGEGAGGNRKKSSPSQATDGGVDGSTRAVRKIMKMILSMICRPTDTDDTGTVNARRGGQKIWCQQKLVVLNHPTSIPKFFLTKEHIKISNLGDLVKLDFTPQTRTPGGKVNFFQQRNLTLPIDVLDWRLKSSFIGNLWFWASIQCKFNAGTYAKLYPIGQGQSQSIVSQN